MIASRITGTARLAIGCQCLLVTLAFWVWLFATLKGMRSRDVMTERYLIYNAVLVMGIVLAYATAREKGWFTQLSWSAAHRKALRQTACAAGFLFMLLAAGQDQAISRVFLFTFLPIVYATLILSHRYVPTILQRLSFGGIRTHRVLIAGCCRNLAALQTWMKSKERLGCSIIGFISHDRTTGMANGLEIMGTPENLEAVIVGQDITQVILVEFPEFKNFVHHYTEVCERHGARLLIVCDFERTLRHPVTMFEDDGVRFLGLRGEPLEDPLGRLCKRVLDIAIALPVVIFVLPPVTFVVALLQRRYSPGPILLRQLRTGLQNLPFAIFKFRTMHVCNDDPSRQAVKGDSRIYRGGALLRKLSIDEFPQFINVLLGDMSIVGPRPHLMEHDEIFSHALMNYPVRATVKPGITGLAQVRGFRGETKTTTDIVKRVESDIYYLENWSILMDCGIILKTATQVFRPLRTAY